MHYDTEIEHQEVSTDEGTVIYEVCECAGDCGERHTLGEMVEITFGEFVRETPELYGEWRANVAMAVADRSTAEVPPVVPLCVDCALDLGYVGPVGLSGEVPDSNATRKLRKRHKNREEIEPYIAGWWLVVAFVAGIMMGFMLGVPL